MRQRILPVLAVIFGLCSAGLAQQSPMAMQNFPESIYAPPGADMEAEATNSGAVNLDLRINYATDYVYRGIEPLETSGHEDAPNYQFDSRLSFDLGKYPHPFVGVFANVADSDPVSRFQEIRPYAGMTLNVAPFTLEGGYTSYIFPDRDDLNTSEFYGKITLDDSVIFHTDKPIFSPYIYAAYDIDLYDGWYIEAGVSHELPIEGTSFKLTFDAHVGYVIGFQQFAVTPGGSDTGFQHYQIGVTGSYSLNALFNVPRRYGQWSLIAYVNYTDGIDNDLRAENQFWGGGGLRFQY